MKTNLSQPKSRKANKPLEVVKEGSISIPIYAHTNIIPQRDPQRGAILYEALPDGKRKALSLARTDKQLFIYLANKSGVPWKRNGLPLDTSTRDKDFLFLIPLISTP